MRVSKPIHQLFQLISAGNASQNRRDAVFMQRLMPALASGIILAWIVGFYTVTARILESSVVRVEDFQSRQQTERVVSDLAKELDKLDQLVVDYATWDATYNFMQTANPSYINSDLGSVLDIFQLNFIAFIRPSGEIIYGTTYELEKKQKIAISPDLRNYLRPESQLISRLKAKNSSQGLIELPQGIMLTVARPIVTSQGKGPSPGTLVMGRYLNAAYSQEIAKRTGVQFKLHSPKTSPDLAKLPLNRIKPHEEEDISFQTITPDRIASYTKLKDINGKPNLVLEIESPRFIYQQTKLSLHYLKVCLLGLGLLAWGILLFLMAKLSQHLQQRDRIQAILSEQQEALFQEKELAQITLQSIGDGVIATDAKGRVSSLNAVAEHLTGWDSDRAKDLPIDRVLPLFDEQNEQSVPNALDRVLQGNSTEVAPVSSYILINRKAEKFDIDRSIASIRDSSGQLMGAVIVIRDVTQAKNRSRQLSWQASYDPLTGLINRREFEHRLEQALTSSQAENQEHCLCFLDLDRFKIINDTCGHLAGDELLRQIGILLKSQVRKTDIVARLGGDEFALLLYQCSVVKAQELAEQICQRVETFRFVWQEKAFDIGVSLGLTNINRDKFDFRSVLLEADRACYVAKRRGRGGVAIYDSENFSLAEKERQIHWESLLNQALVEDDFRLYYQPIRCLKSPAEFGEFYEVLVRLVDVDKNNTLLLPAAFMPSAERYHLMRDIDRWVIEHLFASQKEHYREVWQSYQQQGKKCLYSINLATDTLNDSTFIAFLQEQVNKHNIPTEIISFEVPETIAVANLSQTIKVAQQLKQLGFSFGLDRFGGGISSFGYLKNLPVDFIKIDGALIAEILEDPITLTIVESIQKVAELMGIKTMAEFVTNEAIREKIIEVGIDYAQGYGIAEPRPL
jgi:diguanylate cyclase (GGDEF)-like protein/PAS domain S-box-containing protein